VRDLHTATLAQTDIALSCSAGPDLAGSTAQRILYALGTQEALVTLLVEGLSARVHEVLFLLKLGRSFGERNQAIVSLRALWGWVGFAPSDEDRDDDGSEQETHG